MAGNPKQSDGKKADSEPAVFDSDIGDDWGEAFEAEDYLAPPADAVEEFFLEETAPEPGPGSAPGKTSPPPAPKTAASGQGKPTVPTPAALLAPALATAARFRTQFQNLPPSRKALLLGLPTVLLAAIIIFTLLPPRKSTTAVNQRPLLTSPPAAPEAPLTLATAPILPELEAAAPPEPKATPPAPAEHSEESPPAEAVKIGLGKEKIRKKWPLPNFFIPVIAKSAVEAPVFLAADLTLTLLLEEGADLPLEKELFLRDTIYQFYHNQPLPELRRYSLARHDMNLRLSAWVKKAWPEAPLATIVFDHYTVQ